MSSPSRTVTSLGTSVNVAGGGGERGVTSCGAEARGHPGSLGRALPTPPAARAAQALAKSARAAAGPLQRPAATAGRFPPVRAGRRGRLTLLPSGRPRRYQRQAGARQLPAPHEPLGRSWSPGPAPKDLGAGVTDAATLRRSPPPTAPGRGCTLGSLESVKPSPSLPPPLSPRRPGQDGFGGPGRTPESPAAAKFPLSPSATKSSRARSSSGGRYPGAPSRFLWSISRRGRGGDGDPGSERRLWRRRGLGSGRARARTPSSLPWPRAAPPPPAAGGRQSVQLPRRLARRGSGGGRCSGCAEREVPPGSSWQSVRASFCPVVRRTLGTLNSVSAWRAGRGPGRAGTHPWPGERAPRSPELLPAGLLLLRLPTASSSGGRPALPLPPPPVPARLFPQGEWALSRGAQTWRPTQRSAGRAGPAWRPGSRRGGRGGGREGEGAVSGWAPGRLQSRITRALPPPSLLSPSFLFHSRRRPRPGALPPPRPVAWRDRQPQAGVQPRPAPAWAGGLPTPTLPCFFSISVAREGGLASLCPAGPEALSADPRPQLLTPVWTKSCPALCPRPRPWRAGAREGGRRGPGSRAERRAGPGPGPERAGGHAGVCSVRARSERSARGEQVPEAPRARERAGAAAVSDGRGGVGRGGCGAPGTTPGPGGSERGGVPAPRSWPLPPPLFFMGRSPRFTRCPGGSPRGRQRAGPQPGFGAQPWLRIPRNPGLLKAFDQSLLRPQPSSREQSGPRRETWGALAVWRDT